MRHTKDSRGESMWDMVVELPGQINVSITKPLEKRGFHMHEHKVDHWLCVQGDMAVIVANDLTDVRTSELHTMKAGDLMIIPAGMWHAYQNIGDTNSILVYYETAKSGIDRSDDHELPLSMFKDWATQ